MDFYQDIILKPDREFPATVLMNSLFAKLHHALSALETTSIGVSFPFQQITLGSLLRLHGAESELISLSNLDWIGSMKGFCKISGVNKVPGNARFRTISRKQGTMSKAKMNRLIKRGSLSQDEVKQYRAKMFSKGMDNPYIDLVSNSNGHRHRRYIEFGEIQDHPVSGEFDSFGLSKTATIPWF
jgi:CRISPR-associated endonuclease Csy4